MLMFKPEVFTVKDVGNPEQLLQDFTKYCRKFQEWIVATRAVEQHSDGHADCRACGQAKAFLRMAGGDEMVTLFDHVGMVVEGDTMDEAINKIKNGIRKQTNQATARFKLFQQMNQGGEAFAAWFPKVKEQAERCDWTGYDGKRAARDAILFQSNSKKLQRKVIAEDLSYDDTIKYGLALEQGEKKVEQLRGQKEQVRKEDERVAALEEQVRALQSDQKTRRRSSGGAGGSGGSRKDQKSSSCQSCTRPWHNGSCPGLKVDCYKCGKKGHFSGAPMCKNTKKKEKTRNVEEESETESEESVNRVEEKTEKVRAVKPDPAKIAEVVLTAMDHGVEAKEASVELLINSGVNKTLLSEKDWKKVKAVRGERPPKLKKNAIKFVPFGTKINLPILGRTRCKLRAVNGASVKTLVYVVEGQKQSLMGLKDGEALGIIKIDPKGASEDKVNHLDAMKKEEPVKLGKIVSGGQTQAEIDKKMEDIVKKTPEVFEGLGKAKVEPVHIEIDPNVKPVQQKRRPIAVHYRKPFKEHVEELVKAGVVTHLGPEDAKATTGWIHNVVITHKSWSKTKIRVNLDTRPMAEAVKTSHFPISTPEELRHDFAGSDRFSI